jgi:hypothetical protein
MKLDFLAMVILPTLAAVITFSCPDHPPGNAPPSTGYSYGTLAGVRVTSPVEVPPEALEAIDEGIQAQIARMPAGWANARQPRDYSVKFVAPEAQNQDGSPALIVAGVQTAGTVAGTLCGLRSDDESGTPYIKLPYQDGWQYLEYLKNSAWNEGEHFSESANDCNEFMKWTGANDVHPHRP